MEDRKGRFSEAQEVRFIEALRKLTSGVTGFEGVHPFIAHSDVLDDSALRLVMFPPDKFYSKQETRFATEEVLFTSAITARNRVIAATVCYSSRPIMQP